jgi:hypothetical protein
MTTFLIPSDCSNPLAALNVLLETNVAQGTLLDFPHATSVSATPCVRMLIGLLITIGLFTWYVPAGSAKVPPEGVALIQLLIWADTSVFPVGSAVLPGQMVTHCIGGTHIVIVAPVNPPVTSTCVRIISFVNVAGQEHAPVIGLDDLQTFPSVISYEPPKDTGAEVTFVHT